MLCYVMLCYVCNVKLHCKSWRQGKKRKDIQHIQFSLAFFPKIFNVTQRHDPIGSFFTSSTLKHIYNQEPQSTTSSSFSKVYLVIGPINILYHPLFLYLYLFLSLSLSLSHLLSLSLFSAANNLLHNPIASIHPVKEKSSSQRVTAKYKTRMKKKKKNYCKERKERREQSCSSFCARARVQRREREHGYNK